VKKSIFIFYFLFVHMCFPAVRCWCVCVCVCVSRVSQNRTTHTHTHAYQVTHWRKHTDHRHVLHRALILSSTLKYNPNRTFLVNVKVFSSLLCPRPSETRFDDVRFQFVLYLSTFPWCLFAAVTKEGEMGSLSALKRHKHTFIVWISQ